MWFAGGLCMQWITSDVSRSVDRLLDHPNPSATLQLKPIGPVATRQILTYQVAEQNRYYRESWEAVQLILGFVFFFFMLFFTREDKVSLLIALLMLIAVAAQRFYVTPEIISMGRVLDFVPPDVYSPGRHRLPFVESAYTGIEVAKLGLGFLLAGWLVMGRGRRRSGRDVRQELDLINKANYRHIDR
jgi:hypothetical protein